jgi:hypothetical protein
LDCEFYELKKLQDQFPDFALSAEHARGRWRYLARSRHHGLNPWVVITGDLDELRAVLRRALPRRNASADGLDATSSCDQRIQ